jgi:hypothetical protein
LCSLSFVLLSGKIGSEVNTQFLGILSQSDLLSISSEAIQTAEFKKTKDGIGLISTAEQIAEDNLAYAPFFHFGKTAGALVAHVFVIARNFLLRSIGSRAELEILAEDFLETARRGLLNVRLIDTLEPHSKAFDQNFFRFYYVTNLEPTQLQVPTNEQQQLVEAELHKVHQGIDSEVAKLKNIHLANRKNRTYVALVNHAFVASQLERKQVQELLKGYRRYIFEIKGNDLVLTTALLGGVHCIANESELQVRPAKVSFLETTLDQLTAEAIDELARLVSSKATEEIDLQKFFERYPGLICEGHRYRIYPQIVFERDDGTTLRPDFFLEPIEGEPAMMPIVVDIKRPFEHLLLTRRNRPRFCSKIYEYAAQLREYGDFFDNHTERARVRDQYGIRALRPRLVLIVGKDYEVSDYTMIQRVKQSIFPVELKTYDEVIKFGRSLLSAARSA